MAFRLGEYVVYGEIWNTSHYTTHGIIVLRGETPDEEMVVRLDLTGNCGRDLQGKHFRFSPEGSTQGPVFPAESFSRFQQGQIGPTGTMTAQGWAKTFSCSVQEFVRRSKLGEPPPTEWKRRLYLEWYSQNGRVVVEMADVLVEYCVRESPDPEKEDGEWALLPNLALPPDLDFADGRPARGLGITSIQKDGDDVHVERWASRTEDNYSDEEDETPPIPLQKQLDEQAAAIDRAIRGEDGTSDETVAEMELMDRCIEHGEGKPLGSFLGDLGQLPRPEDLDDAAVETQLKILLANLACVGVALDVCEHFSPRDCYSLLLDKILHDSTAYEELVGTSWAQHVSTWEYCADCEAEQAMPDIEDEKEREF